MLIPEIYLRNHTLLFYSGDVSPELLLNQFQNKTFKAKPDFFYKRTIVVMRNIKSALRHNMNNF